MKGPAKGTALKRKQAAAGGNICTGAHPSPEGGRSHMASGPRGSQVDRKDQLITDFKEEATEVLAPEETGSQWGPLRRGRRLMQENI